MGLRSHGPSFSCTPEKVHSHRRDAATSDMGGQHDVAVKALQDQLVLQFLPAWFVPQVVEFVGVGFEIEQLTEIVFMVDNQLIARRAEHGGEGSVAIAEGRVQRVEILRADTVPVVIR